MSVLGGTQRDENRQGSHAEHERRRLPPTLAYTPNPSMFVFGPSTRITLSSLPHPAGIETCKVNPRLAPLSVPSPSLARLIGEIEPTRESSASASRNGHALQILMPALISPSPKPGQVVQVRSRKHLVEGVVPAPNAGDQTLVRLACLDDDSLGTQLEVLWEKEVDAQIVDDSSWARVNTKAFDPPRGSSRPT